MTETGRKLGCEALGTALLVATVVGSGIMAVNLAGGNVALALLANAIATGAILVVLITIFGPVSGAHFNPVVTLAMWMRGDLAAGLAASYVIAQIGGGVAGTLAAHLMFDVTTMQLSQTARTGGAQWFSEVIAAFGLLLTILGCVRYRPDAVASGVGLYITSAYWFTASTSFANPAVTIARGFTDTFAGIRPLDVPVFILAQIAGAVLALVCARLLFESEPARTP
ncbi:MAG: MIP/aquaporin family protein [Pseudomonadota bacterium]